MNLLFHTMNAPISLLPFCWYGSETRIARAPSGIESVPALLGPLADAHEIIAIEGRDLARRASEIGDEGTNDVLVSHLVRVNEQLS
jgi:hypothetical protein